MTDYCKVRMIGNMISSCLEYTDWSKDNMDALLTCIQTVVEYDGEDYPPIPNNLDFSFDHLPEDTKNGTGLEPTHKLSKGIETMVEGRSDN